MAFSVNRVTLVGNMGGDPEMRFNDNGQAQTKFSLATSYSVKEGEEWVEKTEWHKIVQWGKKAEGTAERYRKGSKVYIEGRLQTRSWDDNGTKKYMTEVVAQEVIGFAGKNDSEGEFRATSNPSASSSGGRSRDNDFDDLPF